MHSKTMRVTFGQHFFAYKTFRIGVKDLFLSLPVVVVQERLSVSALYEYRTNMQLVRLVPR